MPGLFVLAPGGVYKCCRVLALEFAATEILSIYYKGLRFYFR
ncbi:MAG: hypothetical protein OFPI_25100 [Osedax symbiont Rs2]|nr:MAG: hypothetical protein OFPI_25100 [Osedax symbiont Rs2]